MTSVPSRRTIVQGAAIAAMVGTAPVFAAEAPMVAGPDPHPHTPRFKAPPGSIDTHTHIFGPAARYPFAAKRSYTPPDAGLADFDALHKAIGVDRAVIVNATVHGTDNRVVTDAIAASGGRYRGIANIDDTTSDAELDALDKAGIRGVRFTFLARLGGKPDMSRVQRIADRIQAFGWNVDLYFEPPLYDDLFPIIEKLPVPHVINHMGAIELAHGIEQPAIKALVAHLQRAPRAWIKITGPERSSATGAPFHDAVPLAQKLIAAAPDRCLWGTDWPHPNVKTMPNDGDLVDLIPLYAPDEAQRQKLLVGNPEKLFGFPAWSPA